jgi:anaerobic selenocysteine-containing dehydrogenase
VRIEVAVDGDRVVSIKGDGADEFSKGLHLPEATALRSVTATPTGCHPVVRDGSSCATSVGRAYDLVATKLKATRARAYGKHTIGVYQGNPTAHNLGLITFGQLFLRKLGTKNQYSATSLDQLPHMLAALLMFGNQLLMPVPDIDRSDLFICLGANPLASNGSLMTAPDVKGRLKAIRDRGGRVIVVDPRRTETAERADRHVFIRPGSDAVLLLAMIDAVFGEGLVDNAMANEWADAVWSRGDEE